MICANCGAEMETVSIKCGANPGREYQCPDCSRWIDSTRNQPVVYPGRPQTDKGATA